MTDQEYADLMRKCAASNTFRWQLAIFNRLDLLEHEIKLLIDHVTTVEPPPATHPPVEPPPAPHPIEPPLAAESIPESSEPFPEIDENLPLFSESELSPIIQTNPEVSLSEPSTPSQRF